MKGKPNLDAFIDGGKADEAESITKMPARKMAIPEPEKQTKVFKEQKLYRLSSDVVEALKDKAYELTKQKGKRVTETEIVEQAIRIYLDI